MVLERKTQSLTVDERLGRLIDLGIRDAKNQPDAPAMTLVLGMHSDLVRYVFEKQELDYCEDVIAQGEAVGTYVASELVRRGETAIAVRTTVFTDRENTQGIFVYMSKVDDKVHS